MINHIETEERDFKFTVLYEEALCIFIFGRNLGKMCVCVCVPLCACIQMTKDYSGDLLSQMDLLNNHPYTTLNNLHAIFSVNEK